MPSLSRFCPYTTRADRKPSCLAAYLSLFVAMALLGLGPAAGPARAWTYPNPLGLDYPYPMNMADGPTYNFKYVGYNPDGTLASNPVIVDGTPINYLNLPISATAYSGYGSYVFKTLTSGNSLTFSDSTVVPKGTYIVYAAVPDSMTVSGAYGSTAQYYEGIAPSLVTTYPTDVEAWANKSPYNTATNSLNLPQIYFDQGLNYNQALAAYQATPSNLNNAGNFTLPTTTTTSAAGGGDVKLISTSGSNAAYYLPYAVDGSAASNNELSANVFWTTDIRKNFATAYPTGDTYHMIPFGWALDAGNVNQSLTFQNLSSQGGATISGNSNAAFNGAYTLADSSDPFNFWLKLISNESVQYKNVVTSGTTTDIYFPVGVYADLVVDHVNAMNATGGPGYPFPTPTWLQQGAYLPVQPQPGFQGNLNRWFTPWGSWNLVNNTSGLFVTSDGNVETPVYVSTDPKTKETTTSTIPWVTQTWTDQNYVFINNTDQPIPSTTDTYPGGEIYLGGNTYFPGTGGVMNSYKQYMIFDNNNKLSARTPDNWLCLKGDTMYDAMNWASADNTEPGGQANKPYMYSVDVDENGGINFTFETANSTPVAIQDNSVADKVYKAKVYVDSGDGSGYQHLITFDYSWQALTLQDAVSGTTHYPQWTAATGTQGALVPSISDLADTATLNKFNAVLQSQEASSWNQSIRAAIGFSLASTNSTSDTNVSGGNYYQYQFGATLTSTDKVLVVFE